MKGVVDIQRRGQQIGRIRSGVQVQASNGKMRPGRLETFRFTTPSKAAADAVAALYGGEVRPWERGEFEVITDRSEIGVTVPPRDQVVSQFYEMWNRGGALRRCTGQTELLSGTECKCPHAANLADEDEVAEMTTERARLAAMNPPKACKLITRISVVIPDLPGLGVWRWDTHSYYAAIEIGDTADLLQMAREAGIFLPANLRIEQRERHVGGETKKYPVPVLEVLATFREIATGQLAARGIEAQLPPAPGEQMRAIEAPAAQEAAAEADTAAAQPAPAPPGTTAGQGLDAQQIADLALTVAETKADVMALVDNAKAARCLEDFVCTDPDGEQYEELGEVLRRRYRELPAPSEGAA